MPPPGLCPPTPRVGRPVAFEVFFSGGYHDQYFPAGRFGPKIRQTGERRRHRRLDRPRPRQGGAGREGRRQDEGSFDGRGSRRQDRHRDVARPRSARAAAPRRGARARPGGAGALSRHADHVRPVDGRRLLLRLRARPAVLAGGLRQDRAAHGRDRRPRPADHARGVGPRRRSSSTSSTTARSSKPNGPTSCRRTRRSRSTSRATGSTCASARTCPRRASSARRSS